MHCHSSNNHFRWACLGIAALIIAVLIAGCAAPTTAPTQPSASSATPVPIAPAGPPVLVACDAEIQLRAMRPSQRPDWNALGLAACYDLSLDLKPDSQSYTGTARVTFTNRTGSDLPDLIFRLYPNAQVIYDGVLDVTSAQIGGKAVKPEIFLSDRTGLRLLLDQALPEGDTAVIEFAFEGLLPIDFGSGSAYGVFNYVGDEPLMALANWFPMLSVWRDGDWDATPVIGEGDAVVSEVALYRVRVSAPDDWKVVATGTQVRNSVTGESAQYEFVSGPARDFTVLASPSFETRESQAGEVRVVHWGLPDGELSWEQVLKVARDSIEVYTDRFGPYPYTELDVVAAPLNRASGVEYPGLVLIDAGLYDDLGDWPFLNVTVAHEVAHQWWYGVVGNDVLNAPWQDEALTTFSSLLYFETYDPQAYDTILGLFEQQVSDFQGAQSDEPIAQPLAAFRGHGDAYSAIVYLKGALFFAALRKEIGDGAFFGALQEYYQSKRYTIALPDDLLDAFEDGCGCILDATYNEWGVTAPRQ